LEELLTRLALSHTVELATCTVNLTTGRVIHNDGTVTGLSLGQTSTLRILLNDEARHGITSITVSEELDISLAAATQNIMRLRKKLGASLEVRREGPKRLYSVARARKDDRARSRIWPGRRR
jgi:hypothetical protein